MIIQLIKKGDFQKAINQIDFSSFQEDYEVLLSKAYEDEDICYYDFLTYMIENGYNNSQMNYYASELMATVFNFLPEGYKKAFDHAEQAIKLEPNNFSLKEYILMFNEIPDKLLDDATAKSYACEIIKVDPVNKAALKVMSRG